MALRVVRLESVPAVSRDKETLAVARSSLHHQAQALDRVASHLDDQFCRALELLLSCRGRVVVSGIGKSGLIGRKIAATLACSGTPSFFVHPGEAAHGDLGMVTPEDVLILVSNSGETSELVQLLPHFLELGVPIIALVGRITSSLARAASVVLDIEVEKETCPHNLVPTTSALVMLALGDALAMAAMRAREFGPNDFGRYHPGGTLGRRLSKRVKDVMQSQELPLVTVERRVREALVVMNEGRCGLVIVVDEDSRPVGIVTDGDLRRALQERPHLLELSVRKIMSKNPVTISEDATVNEAEERMHRLRIKALVVVNDEQRVSGIVEIFARG